MLRQREAASSQGCSVNKKVAIKEGISRASSILPGSTSVQGRSYHFCQPLAPHRTPPARGRPTAQAARTAGPAVGVYLFGAYRYGPSLPDNLDIKRGSPTQYGRTLCLPVTTAHDETPWKTTVENSVRVLISFSKFYLLFSEEERPRVLLLCHSVIKQE